MCPFNFLVGHLLYGKTKYLLRERRLKLEKKRVREEEERGKEDQQWEIEEIERDCGDLSTR